MVDVLKLAAGVFLALFMARFVDMQMAASAKRREHRAMLHELQGLTDNFVEKMHEELLAERAADEMKSARRRKPTTRVATKKAPARKPVAKKGGKK